MKTLNYQIVLSPEPEGGFTVTVPSLPGCVTYGKDIAQARLMAKDAIEVYLLSLEKHHEPIPQDGDNLFTSVELKHATPA